MYAIVTTEIGSQANGPNPIVPTTVLDVLANPTVELATAVRWYAVRTLTECVAYTCFYLQGGAALIFEVDEKNSLLTIKMDRPSCAPTCRFA